MIINFIFDYKLNKAQSHRSITLSPLPQYTIAKKLIILTTLTQWLWEKWYHGKSDTIIQCWKFIRYVFLMIIVASNSITLSSWLLNARTIWTFTVRYQMVRFDACYFIITWLLNARTRFDSMNVSISLSYGYWMHICFEPFLSCTNIVVKEKYWNLKISTYYYDKR